MTFCRWYPVIDIRVFKGEQITWEDRMPVFGLDLTDTGYSPVAGSNEQDYAP